MKLRRTLPLALLLSAFAALALCASASAAESRLAYVENYEGGTVSVIDTTTMEEVAEPIDVGAQSSALAISPDGKRLYVANELIEALEVFDAETGEEVGTPIPLGLEAAEIAVNPAGTKAFVSSGDIGLVDVVKLDDDPAVVDEIETPEEGIWGVALTPDGKRLWVAEQGGAQVSVFDATDSDEPVGEPIEVGEGPVNIVFTPDGKTAYVADDGSDEVSVVDVASRTVTKTIPVGEDPWGLALTPDGRKLYVANEVEGTVSVIDTTSEQTVGEPIPVGDEPYEIVLTPNGKRAIVAVYGAGEAVAIDTATDTVADESTDLTGEGPWLVVVEPDESPSAGSFTARTGLAGSPIAFTGAVASDPDGSIAHYDWSFGDGTVASTTAPQTSHVYAAAGSFAATFDPIDDEGCGSSQLWTGRGAYCTGSSLARRTVSVGPAPVLPIAKAPSHKIRLGKLKLNKKKGTATLQVVLPAAGKLALTGKKVRRVNRKGGPGKLTLAIRPKVKTLKVLKKVGTAKVKVKVTFTPTGGSPGSASRSLTLVRSASK